MEIVYVISVLILGASFLSKKKNDEKQSFIKWLIIFIISLLGYNITVCMILGILKIKSFVWLLSLINIGISLTLGWKTIKNKQFQKYKISAKEVIGIVLILSMFALIIFKDIKPQNGGIRHVANDAAVHYRMAKMFSDNLMIPINCENKTVFNFSVMQTGSAINDGLLMNVANGIFGIEEFYIYDFFELSIFVLTGLTFYYIIEDKIKSKLGFILTMILIWLYIFAYPYNSYMWGFSYLSLGVLFISGIILILKDMYNRKDDNLNLKIILTSFMSMGLIFSYCFFAPGVFLAICIAFFIKEKKTDKKKYLKYFTKNFIILISALTVIALFGIGYLVIPTFIIKDQTNLIDALKNEGGYYFSLYENFKFYIVFAALYIIELILKIKNKKYNINFIDIFSWTFIAYSFVIWIGMRMSLMSVYYFSKIYYVLWPIILILTIETLNEYLDKKIIFKILLTVYIILWYGLVLYTIIFKAGAITQKWQISNIENYVGIYFDENYMKKGWVHYYHNISKEKCEILNEASKIEDLMLENTILVSWKNYDRIWALAIGDFESEKISYITYVDNPHLYNNLTNDIKYIVNINENNPDSTEYKDYEKVFENSIGYILKKVE